MKCGRGLSEEYGLSKEAASGILKTKCSDYF